MLPDPMLFLPVVFGASLVDAQAQSLLAQVMGAGMEEPYVEGKCK